jgi:DNA adenine methylase
VSDIHLNDVDTGIWAFWYALLQHNEEIASLVENAELTVPEWLRQREIYRARRITNPVELGFATFYLNRTNRSGIIGSGGVIGGLNQAGSYKMDCRFNKNDLAARIRRIRKYRSQIHLTRLDALDFLAKVENDLPRRTFCAIDPPYFVKGSSLYTSFYKPADHADVAGFLAGLARPWILTYDDAPEIRTLYSEKRQFNFGVNYSVQTKRIGVELMIVSDGLIVPDTLEAASQHPTLSDAA